LHRYTTAEIQTDKATMEMESMEDGWVAKIMVAEGTEDIPVGKAVAVLCEVGLYKL
jgi:pyruvate/2-oxoglutarate dehydrogenase complex dihydrolipoamide acyltransferase (E2) component